MARVSCPNCKIPCTGCAGARLTTAIDGTPCCTKCVATLNAKLNKNQDKSISPKIIQPTRVGEQRPNVTRVVFRPPNK